MPSAVRGEAVYTEHCVLCHGQVGDGSGQAGAADFTDLEFMRGETPAEFFQAIRDGVEGTAMPAWGPVLSEMEMWDVLYYEWTFATSPDEIAAGQALYAENCVSCHGQAGDGSGLAGAANFTEQEFMSREKPAEFFEKITEGVEGSAMPAWGDQFSPDQIWALVNFVWTYAYEYPGAAAEATAEPAPTPLADDDVFPSEAPSAVRGEGIYTENCVTCHGEAGDGSGLAGAADFTDLDFMRGEKPAEFFQAIRDGVEGSAMPAWGARLDDMEMWDVLYYEWTFATSPDQIAEGQALYTENCVTCHGQAGDGSGLAGAASFADQEFMSREKPEEFFEAITEGVDDSAMPAWGDQFSPDQIWALVNFVWTFAYEYPASELEPAAPTPTPSPTPSPTASLPSTPDPAVGRQLWADKPCKQCHGASGEGGIGPRLAGTGLSFDQVLLQVRAGAAPMPAFTTAEVSDLELQHMLAWLKSLAPPTPTPIAAPSFPTGALTTMWQHVNDMKVRSDFAKDLPERQASDDAGRLAILKQYANEALQLGQAAIAQANQARNDIPDAQVRAIIQQVIDHTNAVIGAANSALAQNSFGAAWPHAAEMVRISRLDAWPLATQAVRDAGLVGTVRVRVTDPGGSPIGGAFATVLTAHTPVGVRTDSSGRATIVNVAAVPALQVKAYTGGLVYHEQHVNLSPGATAEARITLPGPNVGGQTPAVSNASIQPASGSGNATVTLRVTATDPQGHLNLAEDQVFALNPDVRAAYVLRSVGGDDWATTITLPNLSQGTHTWYFFAVDHQCNTSNVLSVTYTVP
jgi:mono/diheme cytochrome c family protein